MPGTDAKEKFGIKNFEHLEIYLNDWFDTDLDIKEIELRVKTSDNENHTLSLER